MKHKIVQFRGKLHQNLPYVPKRKIFEKLYQDIFGIGRMLHQ